MVSKRLVITCFLLLVLISSLFSVQPELTLDPAEAKSIAKEAYIFAYPMLEHYRTMYLQLLSWGKPNEFTHIKQLYGPKNTMIVRPNNDTVYSMVWMDLTVEPIVISIPEIRNRYFAFQLVDMYTHNLDYIGARTTGPGPTTFMVAGPKP